MARDLLSKLNDWDLVYEEQDVRGRDAFDAAGNRLGEIKDMLADTDAGRVVALVLENGQQYDADLVEIGDKRVVIHTTTSLADARAAGAPRVYADVEGDHLRPRTATSDTYAGGTVAGGTVSGTEASFGTPTAGHEYVAARDAGLGTTHPPSGTDAGAYAGMSGLMGSSSNPLGSASFDDFTADDDRYFRDYHRSAHGEAAYEDHAPAYRFGMHSGRRGDWHGHDWEALEPEMRRDYDARFGEGAWERFKESARHGFQRARNAVTGGEDGHRHTPR
ncbi:MAG TPA: PRC-barrel domain-containing protein [Rhodothermales bacterium]|nr:PRC-barrel domain-containing protein [Rhodothermales bacterium]